MVVPHAMMTSNKFFKFWLGLADLDWHIWTAPCHMGVLFLLGPGAAPGMGFHGNSSVRACRLLLTLWAYTGHVAEPKQITGRRNNVLCQRKEVKCRRSKSMKLGRPEELGPVVQSTAAINSATIPRGGHSSYLLKVGGVEGRPPEGRLCQVCYWPAAYELYEFQHLTLL